MEYFQRAVLTVSAILLIICLVIIGVSLYTAKYSDAFPPVLANCPDYWLDKSSGNASECFNIKGLGKPECERTKDFSSFSTGNAGLCSKKKWAKSCDITWDGISNNETLKCI